MTVLHSDEAFILTKYRSVSVWRGKQADRQLELLYRLYALHLSMNADVR